jgi:hypothetical protein
MILRMVVVVVVVVVMLGASNKENGVAGWDWIWRGVGCGVGG